MGRDRKPKGLSGWSSGNRPDAVQEALERIKLNEAVKTQRVNQFVRREDCLLAVATAILVTKCDLDWTYDDFVNNVLGISDKGHASRLANRNVGLKKSTYLLITASLNEVRVNNGLDEWNFPEFPDTYDNLLE